MKREGNDYGTQEHFSERVNELRKVLKSLVKHGSVVDPQRDNLLGIVNDMEEAIKKMSPAE